MTTDLQSRPAAPRTQRGFMARYNTFMSRRASLMPTLAAVAILIILMVAAQVRFDRFLSPGNLSALLLDNAYLVVLAVGMTFVILTGGIDLSVGSVMAFTGILSASLLSQQLPAIIVIPVMLLGGAAIGLMIGVLVQYFNVQPFIASLVGMFLARGLCYVLAPRAIKVTDVGVLGLQSTKIGGGGWYITATVIIAYFFARSRLLARELDIIRSDYATAGGF